MQTKWGQDTNEFISKPTINLQKEQMRRHQGGQERHREGAIKLYPDKQVGFGESEWKGNHGEEFRLSTMS